MRECERLDEWREREGALWAMTGAPSVLSLYRSILRAAKHFPSKKRDGIIQGIRLEFRANKVSLHACIEHARKGAEEPNFEPPE